MTNTKKMLAALIVATGTATIALPSMARDYGDCPMGGERGQGRMAERMNQQQQRLHDALKLNPEQEKAWAKYQESRPFGQGMRAQQDDLSKLSAPERADKMLELQRQHQEAMTKHVAAMKEFYGQLTPEQKKTFDENSMMHGRHGGKRGGGQGPATSK
jgi:Spy/CpxP family protein refolding chaperone